MTEHWLRGPIEGIPPLLQPVAHALLQARDEVNEILSGFPSELLWQKPAGLASVGFHLQHLTGVLDRLFSYAKGHGLNEEQFRYLKAEGQPIEITLVDLLQHFNQQVDHSLQLLSTTDTNTLTDHREVGRGKLPSTVIGLLTHAAEHTMRHTGQLLVTARFLAK
ncbi:DinB family protein [Flavihumibacter fluvii]|uniref:DinB family protein n=1 Tax=Flavihumibacter fluvii TaxID=2838157 RepID=UPI001BDF104C|nr:DinB family protein [Flavihumibacter fluvii]ULQ51295.1 DinB family protein [Flavihumibacter fluvii]